MIEYSHANDVVPLVIVDLWNTAFGPSFPMSERLLLQTLEADPFYKVEGSWVARDGDRVVGYVLCKSMQEAGPEMGRFQGRGGIGALCVHPAYQRRGIGGALLDRAEEYLLQHDSPLTTLYFPHHFLPGIPDECTAARALFEKRGYTNWYECVDLMRDLGDFCVPEKVWSALEANPTVEIRPARETESAALIAMVQREFPGGWTYSTRGHFERNGRASEIIVAVEGEEIIGFCHTADFNSNWLLSNTHWFPLLGEKFGGLGPLGLAKEHRKRGLGLAITALAVDDLKRRGVETMVIDWTNLVSFYEKLGFRVWKKYWQAERIA